MKKVLLSLLALAALSLSARAEKVTFTANAITAEKGTTATLEVSMTNDFDVRDFQCFIDLPAGITPALNAQGRPDVSWGSRQSDHALSTSLVGSQCRVIGFSASGATFTGNSGVLFTLPLELNVAASEYTLTLTNSYASKNDGSDVAAPTATAKVTVVVYPESVKLNKTTTEILLGSSETLTATLAPEDVTEKTLTWTSSDEKVATVKDGKVTAVGLGNADITVSTVNGKTAVCSVKVNPILATSVTLSKTTAELLVDETLTLTAEVAPANTTDKSLTWTSSDEKVATVKDGKVTAVGVGSATITATTTNGIKGTCTVKVNPVMASAISIDGGDKEIFLGASVVLSVTFNPANTTDKSLTWSSSDEKVVTISDGKVTGVGLDQATITATTTNGVSASINVKVNEIVITSVTLDASSMVLKEGEKSVLNATVQPADATFVEITWASSDEAVATVDGNGTVTAVARGNATITATTPNNLTATCAVKVVMNGDSSDNGVVSINDVTMAVNDILGRENPADYQQHAADVNNDGSITVADVVGIANIILGRDVDATRSAAKVAGIESFANSTVEGNVLNLTLDEPTEYVAMQFEMELSEGLEIVEVSLTNANAGSHVVAYNMVNDTHVRVVAYSLMNEYFAEGSTISVTFAEPTEAMSALVKLNAGITVDSGMLEIGIADEVIAFELGQTGIEDMMQEADCVYYTLDGVEVDGNNPEPGVYIRVVGDKAEKVLIK